jgi:hypothetical protein
LPYCGSQFSEALAVKVTDWQAEAAVGTIVALAVIVGATVLKFQFFVA